MVLNMDLNSSNRSEVERWNDEIAHMLLPNTVILCCYLVIGLIGNSLVIVVYRIWKNKSEKEERYMIPILAVCDLLTSVIVSSFQILLNMRTATFTNNKLCKTLAFMNGFLTFLSISVLFIIAVQRYLKICRPPGERKMTLLVMRILTLSCIIFAAVIASPIIFFYGSTEFPKEGTNLVGYKCKRRIGDNHETEFKIYGSFLILVLIVLIIAFLAIYIKIGHKLYVHFKNINHKEGCQEIGNESIPTTKSSSSPKESDHSSIIHQASKFISIESRNGKSRFSKSMQGKIPNVKRNEKLIQRITSIFMIITIVFIFCYVPRVAVLMAEGLTPNYWKGLSSSELPALVFVHQTYLINNIVNPIIYAFFDRRFHEETNKCFKQLRPKCI